MAGKKFAKHVYLNSFGFIYFEDREPDENGHHPRKPNPKPLPKVPSESDIRTMFSTTHSQRHIRSGLTLPDLESVKAAIAVYGGTNIGGSLSHTAGAMDGIGGMLLLMNDASINKGSFLNSLFKKIDEAFSPTGKQSFYCSWDYDGPGPFHKSSVSMARSEDQFNLHFSGAYTSDRDEKLGKKLGIDPNYIRADHEFTWASTGARYAIPGSFFRNILSIVEPRVFAQTPDLLMQDFAHQQAEFDHKDAFADELPFVREGDRYKISLNYVNYRVLPRYKWVRSRNSLSEDALRAFQTRIEGDALTGPAREHTEYDEPIYGAVGLDVSIYPKTKADEEFVKGLSDKIAFLYSDLSPAYPPSDY